MDVAGTVLPTLRFRGLPATLDSLIPLPPASIGADARIAIHNIDPAQTPFVVFASSLSTGITHLRTSVDAGTPPGIYTGIAESGGKSFPVELQVEPYIHLSLSPRQLYLDVAAGQKIQVELVVANSGNVACEIGKALTFGLFNVHGAERAIGAALRQNEQSGEKRLDRLMDEFADQHAGVVRIQVLGGSGSIAPGEARPLKLNLHLPSGIKADQTYSGTMPLQNLRYYVKVRAIAGTASDKAAAASDKANDKTSDKK